MFTGSDNERAIDVLPLINTQALRMEMNPPFNSIPDRIRARLDMITVFATTMEYAIPPEIVKSSEGMWSFSKQLKAMKRTQKHVALAEMISSVFQICVWRTELKIPAREGGGLSLSDRITNDFVMRRKERENGRTRIELEMVWESLRLRIVKNSDSGGNPAALKSDRRWEWKERKSGRREEERRRIEAENGRAKLAAQVK
ncbi:hypothetical protein L1987_51713 [Smallanthus sonchifolius]|uniref:Uncharacterized protein n=1 Tax=Smallanthus sonchifolius TaxID=185202 RepID=A0ACB9ERI0_9ASTR|nr:hypothetical protein L1987_51713 [Smallanthus sonchifolius]